MIVLIHTRKPDYKLQQFLLWVLDLFFQSLYDSRDSSCHHQCIVEISSLLTKDQRHWGVLCPPCTNLHRTTWRKPTCVFYIHSYWGHMKVHHSLSQCHPLTITLTEYVGLQVCAFNLFSQTLNPFKAFPLASEGYRWSTEKITQLFSFAGQSQVNYLYALQPYPFLWFNVWLHVHPNFYI